MSKTVAGSTGEQRDGCGRSAIVARGGLGHVDARRGGQGTALGGGVGEGDSEASL